MAQTPATREGEGDMIDYTPVAAVTAGDVILLGTLVLIALSDIAAGVMGALCARGLFKVPKVDAQAGSAGDAIYWDVDGTPVVGTASSGAASTSSAVGNLMGWLVQDAASGDAYYFVELNPSKRTATIAGSLLADDITASDSVLTIAGLPATQGGQVVIEGGASAGGNNNGGKLTLRGGTKNGSGADAVLEIGLTNTSAINVGAAGILTANSGNHQVRGTSAVTATTGGGTTGLIPAGASFVVVTSDSADKQISLPAASVGDRIRILVGATGCELISAVAAHKVNDVTVGATNEAALTATNLYDCQYVATNTWVVIGYTKLGAVQAALVPDAL